MRQKSRFPPWWLRVSKVSVEASTIQAQRDREGKPRWEEDSSNFMLCQLCFHLFLQISASVSLIQPCLDIRVPWFPLSCSRIQTGHFWFLIDFIFSFKICHPSKTQVKIDEKKENFNKIEMNTLYIRKLWVELHPSPPWPQPDYLFCKYLNSSNWLPFLGNLTYWSKDHAPLHNQVLLQKFSPISWTEFTEF